MPAVAVAQAAVVCLANELGAVVDQLRPEGFALTVANLVGEAFSAGVAQQHPAPELVHPYGEDDIAGADLLSLAQLPLEVGGI